MKMHSFSNWRLWLVFALFFVFGAVGICSLNYMQTQQSSGKKEIVSELVKSDFSKLYEVLERLDKQKSHMVEKISSLANKIDEIDEIANAQENKNSSAFDISGNITALKKINSDMVKELDSLGLIYSGMEDGDIDKFIAKNAEITASLYEDTGKIFDIITSIENQAKEYNFENNVDNGSVKTALLDLKSSIDVIGKNSSEYMGFLAVIEENIKNIEQKINSASVSNIQESDIKQIFEYNNFHAISLLVVFIYLLLFMISLKWAMRVGGNNDENCDDNCNDAVENGVEKIAPQVNLEENKSSSNAEEEKSVKERISKEMKLVAEQFETSVVEVLEKLQKSSMKLNEAIATMKDDAANSAMMCDAVASSSQNSSASIETSAAAVEEMGASIREVAVQVANAEQITCDAVTKVDQARRTVSELDESAKEIRNIVKLINDIADRTNLLALNATIEAARAGEAGKGFTVVANEVKALSSQTAKATDEITEQVKNMLENVSHAVEAITSIGEVMEKMDEVSASVAESIEEQSSAVGEIASSTQSAASGAKEISEDVKAVSESAKNSQNVAEELVALVGELRKDTADMEEKIDVFLDKIRNVG